LTKTKFLLLTQLNSLRNIKKKRKSQSKQPLLQHPPLSKKVNQHLRLPL